MNTTTLSPTVGGRALTVSAASFGTLRATPVDCDPEAMREAMAEDGYLYIPGFFSRDDVLEVRGELVSRLARADVLDAGSDIMDAVIRRGAPRPLLDDAYQRLAVGNEPLHRLLYSGKMIAFWQRFLGAPVLHFDYTWIRATPPGSGTSAHTDIVFMGRGTKQLYTTWVPYGDIPVDLGGLAILEHGHRHAEIVEDYGSRDVDTYCENLGESAREGYDQRNLALLDEDADHLRANFGGRWLTTDYRAGDLLTFGMFTPHVGIDNATEDRLRLSSDSRYQLASEAVDERWIGPAPVGHRQGRQTRHDLLNTRQIRL